MEKNIYSNIWNKWEAHKIGKILKMGEFWESVTGRREKKSKSRAFATRAKNECQIRAI